MPELQNRLEKLMLRLDHMGMRVEQAVIDACRAIRDLDEQAGREVEEGDVTVDREEVEIEQECIRLLALYQPAAVDLRVLCMVIKVNNDLERIADQAVHIARRPRHMIREEIDLQRYKGFDRLAQEATEVLGRTVRLLNAADLTAARTVIESDHLINHAYKEFVSSVLDIEGQRVGGAEVAITLLKLARSFERIGDLCTNIAEDIIFLRTGDIVRHAGAFGEQEK